MDCLLQYHVQAYLATLGRRFIIGFIVLSSDLQAYVLDTCEKREADLTTNHHLEVNWTRWWGRLPDRPGKPKKVVRVHWECLVDAPVCGVFNLHLQEIFLTHIGVWGH